MANTKKGFAGLASLATKPEFTALDKKGKSAGLAKKFFIFGGVACLAGLAAWFYGDFFEKEEPGSVLTLASVSIYPPLPDETQNLALPEIRWCLMQAMALDFVAPGSENSVEIGVYNAAVKSYNSRCANIAFNPDKLQIAQEEINYLAPAIKSEAANFVHQGKNYPDWQQIEAARRIFNILGYAPGSNADNQELMTATKNFQTDFGLKPTGILTVPVIEQLEKAYADLLNWIEHEQKPEWLK